MTSRLLPREEWPRLVGTEMEPMWPHLDPADAMVLVIEDEGEIVGTLALYRQVHVHGLWVHEDYRRTTSVIGKLRRAMHQVARAMGARTMVTGVCGETLQRLVEKVGASPLPGTAYVIPVEEGLWAGQ